MHPADDLSLEELRARKSKYRKGSAGSAESNQMAVSSGAAPPPQSSSSSSPAYLMSAGNSYPNTSIAQNDRSRSGGGAGQAMTGAAVAQAAMMAQITSSMAAADQQNSAILAAQAMAQAAANQNQQKQLEDLNRVVMMQRFQQARQGQPPTLGMVRSNESTDRILSGFLNFRSENPKIQNVQSVDPLVKRKGDG